MAPGAVVLPLIMRSPSEHLDPTFYSNFHYHNVFYYPMLRGGGVIPDLFDNRLMPAAFREGKRPKRPRQRKLHRWAEYRDSYDYIITQGLPAQGHQQLNLHMTPLVRSGPWQLYGQPGW